MRLILGKGDQKIELFLLLLSGKSLEKVECTKFSNSDSKTFVACRYGTDTRYLKQD